MDLKPTQFANLAWMCSSNFSPTLIEKNPKKGDRNVTGHNIEVMYSNDVA